MCSTTRNSYGREKSPNRRKKTLAVQEMEKFQTALENALYESPQTVGINLPEAISAKLDLQTGNKTFCSEIFGKEKTDCWVLSLEGEDFEKMLPINIPITLVFEVDTKKCEDKSTKGYELLKLPNKIESGKYYFVNAMKETTKYMESEEGEKIVIGKTTDSPFTIICTYYCKENCKPLVFEKKIFEKNLKKIVGEIKSNIKELLEYAVNRKINEYFLEQEITVPAGLSWGERLKSFEEAYFGESLVVYLGNFLEALFEGLRFSTGYYEVEYYEGKLTDLIKTAMDKTEKVIEPKNASCSPEDSEACAEGFYLKIDFSALTEEEYESLSEIEIKSLVDDKILSEKVFDKEELKIFIENDNRGSAPITPYDSPGLPLRSRPRSI